MNTNKTVRQVSKRNSNTVNAQSATVVNSSTTSACKAALGGRQTTSSAGQHTSSRNRNKSKKVSGLKTATSAGAKWVTKETGTSSIRVRKVFMQHSNRISSAGNATSNQTAAVMAQMSKSAEGKVPGFNLLTTSKDRKNTHHNLAPIKQRSHKGPRKERSTSIKSPQIIKNSAINTASVIVPSTENKSLVINEELAAE